MKSPRSRFSRRHLLALCTFLVPLVALAILGQNELRRQGDQIDAALLSEARLHLDGAVQAIEQQIAGHLPDLVSDSRDLLANVGVIAATVQLRDQARYAALLDILVLDAQSTLIWPQPPPNTMSLAFSRDPRVHDPDTQISDGLNIADLHLTTGRFAAAEKMLAHLVAKMEKADDTRSRGYLQARFRLATVHKGADDHERARAGFEFVRDRVFPPAQNIARNSPHLGLLSETALAEMGSLEDRLDLLARIASNRRYSSIADGLLTAVVERLVEGIPESAPRQRAEAVVLMREERQRARTRRFAGDYDIMLKEDLRQRVLQSTRADIPPGDIQIVATIGEATTMLWVRDATDDERETFRGAERIALHVDLGLLLAPALDSFIATDSSFLLAIDDPDDVPLVAMPKAVPASWVPPSSRVHGLRLSVYPADSEQLAADVDARNRNNLTLLIALFVAAMAGALWLWRSVSREAELAALKVDLVSRVSHELKTPLALIRMYGETLVLGRARDSDQAQQFGGIIARESERLTTMIQRILDFSRQQAGTLTYDPADVQLHELLHRICDAYTPHLEARGAILSDMVRTEAVVSCDENACESAVVNLLENAAKYAIEGDDDQDIELGLEIADDRAIIEVRDRGRGIPDEELDRIFDPFHRAANSGEVRGAGIGLSLVQHFAQSHGGSIEAHARDGGGATFRLILPLAGSKLAITDKTS